MARGTLSKENITRALLQVFAGAFVDSDGKTIRIPTKCEGETIEIKVALTAAKDVLGQAADKPEVTITPQDTELTKEELDEVRELLESLNL